MKTKTYKFQVYNLKMKIMMILTKKIRMNFSKILMKFKNKLINK